MSQNKGKNVTYPGGGVALRRWLREPAKTGTMGSMKIDPLPETDRRASKPMLSKAGLRTHLNYLALGILVVVPFGMYFALNRGCDGLAYGLLALLAGGMLAVMASA